MATGLLEIHVNIADSRGNYCSVCYRTVSQRRLVEPVHLKKLMTNIKNFVPLRTSFKVCYICESLAASAARFCEAVQLASRVADLFQDINSGGQWKEVVKCVKDVRRKGPNFEQTFLQNKPPTHVHRRAVTIDRLLWRTSSYELSRTETLVVDSIADKSRKKPPPPPEPDDVVIIDADDPLPVPSIPSDMFVLLPPAPPAPPPAPAPRLSQISITPDQTKVQIVNNDTNEVILHPIVKGTDGNMYVPSLQLQLDNGVFKNVPNTFIPNTPSQITNSPIPNIPQIAKSKETNDEMTKYHNFIKSQTQEKLNGNVEIIKTNSINIILNDNKKRKIDDSLIQNRVQHILSEHTQVLSDKPCEIVIDDDSISDGLTESRTAVLKTDRTVDWEDKIPMDVISFMDATDPDPQQRIMQPRRPAGMGFISDVRTVPIDVRGECLDLC